MGGHQLDPKVGAKERKVFDPSLKVKERFRMLVTLLEDGCSAHDACDIFKRRGQQIVELYKLYVRALLTGFTTKGKVVQVETVAGMADVLKKLILFRPEVSEGWEEELLVSEIEKLLHIENHQSVRHIGYELLLAYMNALGRQILKQDSASANLLLSAFDWNAVRQMSAVQPGLALPPAVRVLRAVRHDFVPKRTAQPKDSDSQKEAVSLFSEFFEFAGSQDSPESVACWWAFFRTRLVPILYPREAEACGMVAAPCQLGFDRVSLLIHMALHRHLLLPYLTTNRAGCLLATVSDLHFLLRLFQISFATPRDTATLRRTVQLFSDWLQIKSAGLDALPPLIMNHTALAMREFGEVASLVFFANESQPSVDLVLLCEAVSDFFVTVQKPSITLEKEARVSLLDSWLRVTSKIFAAVEKGVRLAEYVCEVVSRSLWVQWVTAAPPPSDLDLWTSLANTVTSACERCTALLAPGDARSGRLAGSYGGAPPPVAEVVPIVTCSGADSFTGNYLVRHWRRVVHSMLRHLLSRSAPDCGLPRSYTTLVLLSPGPSQRGSPHVEGVAHLFHSVTPEFWYKLVTCLCNGGEVRQQAEIHLEKLHTIADVVSDLLFAAHAHKTIEPRWTKQGTSDTSSSPLLCTSRRPMPLKQNGCALTRRHIEAFAVPIFLRASERTDKPFTSRGGVLVAVAALCDIVAMGVDSGHSTGIRTQLLDAISKALTGRDTKALQVAVYHLFPCASPGALTAAPHLFTSEDTLPLLGPLVLAARTILEGCLEWEGRGRENIWCSASALQLWALPFTYERAMTSLPTPRGWIPEGPVANTLPTRTLPENMMGLRPYIVQALLAGAKSSIPEVAGISVKGLAHVVLYETKILQQQQQPATSSFTSASSAMSDVSGECTAVPSISIDRVLTLIGKSIMNPDVALTALTALLTVAEQSPPERYHALSVLLVASSTLLALSHFRSLRRGRTVQAMLTTLHAMLPLSPKIRSFPLRQLVDGVGDASITINDLVLDTLSYASTSRTAHKWMVPEALDDASMEVVFLPPGHPVPPGYLAVPGAVPWWGSESLQVAELIEQEQRLDEPMDTADTIQVAADVALEHLSAHTDFFPTAHRRSHHSSLSARDLNQPAVPCHVIRMSTDRRALIALVDTGTVNGPLYMVARTITGRYCWEVKRVVAPSDSVFPLYTTELHHGQRRSKTGAVVGRVRTHALHEATTGAEDSDTLCDGSNSNQKLSEAMADLTPPFIAQERTSSRAAASGWKATLSDLAAGLPVLPPPPENEPLPRAVPPADPTTLPAYQGGLPGRLSRSFLATGPMLDSCTPGVPAYRATLPTSICRIGKEVAELQPLSAHPVLDTTGQDLWELDGSTERDTVTIAVLYAREGQATASEVLGNGMDDVSDSYRAFLRGLGWTVGLDTHEGFSGGVEYDETCQTLLYYATPSLEIAYHVPAMIEGEKGDAVLEQRRRLISGDAVHVVWCEGTSFNPNTMSFPSTQQWVVLHPTSEGLVRVSISQRLTHPTGLLVDGACVSAHIVAPLVRSMAVRSTKPSGRPSSLNARRVGIADIVSRHRTPASSLSEFAIPLFSCAIAPTAW